jgi:hypothetical protein
MPYTDSGGEGSGYAGFFVLPSLFPMAWQLFICVHKESAGS